MQKILKKIGLTDGEIRVYLALLKLGSSSTGPIIDKSHITSSKVYLILERLEQKGLVSHIIKNNVKYFQTADPTRILDYMDERIHALQTDSNTLEKIVPQLQEMRNSNKSIQETTMFQGVKGFKTSRKEFIGGLRRGDEYVVFGSKAPKEKLYETVIKEFNVENEKLGIKTRLIYNSDLRSIKKVYRGFKLAQVRFIDSITPSSIAITKTKLLLMAYGESPIQVLISSDQLAKSFYTFFESVWLQATKL